MKLVQDITDKFAKQSFFSKDNDYLLDYYENRVWDNQTLVDLGVNMDPTYILTMDVCEEGIYILNSLENMYSLKNKEVGFPEFGKEYFINICTEECEYAGYITYAGNIFVIQYWGDGHASLLYSGSRGKLKEELTGTAYEDIFEDGPDLYETSGPEDMLPTEDAYEYTVRKFEEGDKEPLKYWVNKAVETISKRRSLLETEDNVLSYAREHYPYLGDRVAELEKAVEDTFSNAEQIRRMVTK